MYRNILNYWTEPNTKLQTNKLKSVCLNFGPQHPAAHGVLRMLLQLRGEVILKGDPHIGFLHRGTEKLIEQKTYIQALPYFDRLDYVSTLVQEHTFCLAIENLIKDSTSKNIPLQTTRVLFDELTRILNHLLAVSCHALDVGSMSPLFWSFEEREKIMEFYERISGARMHTAYYRPEMLHRHVSTDLLEDIFFFTNNFYTTWTEMYNTLTHNNIWKLRLRGVGSFSITDVKQWGLSGVMARSTGLSHDIRINPQETYATYKHLPLTSYTSNRGDSYDRFILRMLEMLESNQLATLAANNLTLLKNDLIQKNFRLDARWAMEDTIRHFKYWTEGEYSPKGLGYSATESPKGEFGVFLICDGSKKPLRCKIRSPSYHHLQFLKHLCKGSQIADLVTLMGTIDIVFGEIDR